METNDVWYVYIVRCSDGSYYTGITNNVEERVKEHNAGEGAVFTRERKPLNWFLKSGISTKWRLGLERNK